MGYKAQSITSKASSACKMNMDLVNGNTKANKTTDNGVDALSAGFQSAIAPPKESSPAEMRSSPAKLPIAAIAKVAPMVLGALGKGKKEGGGGGGTKVVVNNSANSSSNSTSNSQAAGGIDPK